MTAKKMMKKRCEMTMETFDFKANYFPCGKPAKYITPKDKLSGRKMNVCGIHKNSVDAFYKRIGSNKKCEITGIIARGKRCKKGL